MTSVPPGPKGVPLFGSSRRYADDPFAFLSSLEEAYGRLARFELGPMETYMVNDPVAVERILVSESERFRKPDFQGDALSDLLGEGLLLSEGETWRTQRTLANPAFRMSRLSEMTEAIGRHAETMLEEWNDGQVRNVELDMQRVTLNVILDLMLGVELEASEVRRIQRSLEPLGARFEPDPIRWVSPRWLRLPGDREFDEAVSTLEDVLDDVVERRRGTEGEEGDPDAPMDFLSILLRAQNRGEQSARRLRDEMMTMLLAGHDTTALTLTFTWYLLSGHPEAERRLHEEVDDVVGERRPTFEDVGNLEYTERVIEEAMRLYPPVWVMFRQPTEPVELSGYDVPEGAAVMLSQWAMHRSERHWEDADAFDPDRWRPERVADRHRFTYFPFGGGPRHCIGKHLAMLEAQVILAMVAHRYRLEYVGPETVTLRPSLTAHPREGMEMRLSER